MPRLSSRRSRALLVVVGCLIGVVGLVGVVGCAPGERAARGGAVEPSPTPVARHADRAAYAGVPRIVFRNTEIGPSYGLVAEVPLSDPGAERALTDVVCDRVDANAHGGSCLRAKRGVSTSYEWLHLGPDLTPGKGTPLAGTPSRTRLSPDGRLEASTVFVTGHTYGQSALSTATAIRAVGGRSYGNLESFRLVIDGRRVTAADRNIWGVTFSRNDDTFYATAQTEGIPYLVKGDLSARTLTAVRRGPECPSLSPDGTRVAYKLAHGTGSPMHWNLAVLDLRTGRQRVLAAERRSVDDQVAWLDDRTLLYGLPRADQAGVDDVWALKADGSGRPIQLIRNAWSPAVVR